MAFLSSPQIAGWSAYASVASMIISAVFLVLFFSRGEPFGTLNDIFSIFLFLFMIPVALTLHTVLVANAAALARLLLVLGLAGIATGIIAQTLLVFRVWTFEQNQPWTLGAGGVVGAWLLIANILALSQGLFPAWLPWFGIVAGLGYILTVVGFWIGGQQNPLFIVGSLGILVGYAVWAIGVGRVFLPG